jgi:hypothetical protein
MPTLEIILRDDAGQAIDGRSVKKYPLDCKMKTFRFNKVSRAGHKM